MTCDCREKISQYNTNIPFFTPLHFYQASILTRKIAMVNILYAFFSVALLHGHREVWSRSSHGRQPRDGRMQGSNTCKH